MIVAISIGTFVKLIVSLVVAVLVIVVLLAEGATTESTTVPREAPAVDVRADR